MRPTLLWLIGVLAATGIGYAEPIANPLLDRAYAQMYNLDFSEAHKTLAGYTQTHPEDPMGPASDAAAWMFAELDRLSILQTEFFVHDDNFTRPKKLIPDPNVRKAFDGALGRGQSIADGVLRSMPRDPNALFASILILGMRSDFDGLIDKKYLSSISSMKTSRLTAEKLLSIDPNFHDAHLAVGVENYVLSLKPAPVRWILQLTGAEVSKDKGVELLSITASRGHYLQPFARLLLAVAALRDNDKGKARELLEGLARQFPNNRLYVDELRNLAQANKSR